MPHEAFYRTKARTPVHDIAIVRLHEPIKFSNTIQAIDLPDLNNPIQPGTTCKVGGWGFIAESKTLILLIQLIMIYYIFI